MTVRAASDLDRKVVARGAVLVDPRAAIEKLRMFLLAEPGWYVLELLRVAVLSGATQLEIENDSNDLVLTFDGEPPHASELAHILDHVFSTADRRLRLFALAINAALGLRPKFIDIYTTRHDGPVGLAARVRWRVKDLPRAADSQSTDLAPADVSLAAMPRGLGTSGVRIHVRERFGTSVAREWFRSVPAETRVIRERSRRFPIPIMRAGRPLQRDDLPAALAIEPFGSIERGFVGELQLVPPGAASNRLELYELGVLMESRSLHAADAESPLIPPPFVASVDAPMLPTNASRSRVDLDSSLGREILAALNDARTRLIDRAVATLPADGAGPMRQALLAALLAADGDAFVSRLQSAEHRDALSPIRDAAVVPLATGGWHTPRLGSGPVLVWRAKRPIDPEIAPWTHPVVWSLGHPVVEAVLARFGAVDGGPAVEAARGSAERHRRFLRHAPTEPRVAFEGDAAWHVAFGQAPAGIDAAAGGVALPIAGTRLPDGLCGQLLVRPGQAPPHDVTATVFISSRPFSTEAIGVAPCRLDIAVESPRFRTNVAFDALDRDAEWFAAVDAVRGILMECADFAAQVASADSHRPARSDPRWLWIGTAYAPLDAAQRAALLRAVVAWTLAPASVTPERARTLLIGGSALARAPIWRVAGSDERISFDAISRIASRTPVGIPWVASNLAVERTDARPILWLDPAESQALALRLGSGVPVVDYAPYVVPHTAVASLEDARKQIAEAERAPWLEIGAANVRVQAVLAGRCTVALIHRGVNAGTYPWTHTIFGIGFAVDDPGALPRPPKSDAGGSVLSDAAREAVRDAGFDLVSALVSAIDGSPPPGLHDAESAVSSSLVRSTLVRALDGMATRQDDAVIGRLFPTTVAQLRAAIERAPLLEVASGDAAARTSLGALRASAADGQVAYLRKRAPDCDFGATPPALLDDDALRTRIASRLGLRFNDIEDRLEPFRDAQIARLARERVSSAPAVNFEQPGTGAVGDVVSRRLAGLGEITAWATSVPDDEGGFDVLVGDRVAFRAAILGRAYPLAGRIRFDRVGLLSSDLGSFTTAGADASERLVRVAAAALIKRVAREPAGAVPPDAWIAVIVAWLADARQHGSAAEKTTLRSLPLWPRVGGGRISGDELSSGRKSIRYTHERFEPWVAPPKLANVTEFTAAHVPQGPRAASWLAALEALTSLPCRDVTAQIARLQRQWRVHSREPMRIALAPDLSGTSLSARIEDVHPALGVGEIRIVADTPARNLRVHLYDGGVVERSLECESPIGVVAAVETAMLDERRRRDLQDAVPLRNSILRAARNAITRAMASTLPLPAGIGHAGRWALLSGGRLPSAARAFPAFVDIEGRACSIQELDAEHTQHGRLAYVVGAPSRGELRSPKRIVCLAPSEVAIAARRWKLSDATDEIRRAERLHARLRVPAVSRVGADGLASSGELRVSLTRDAHGYDGEICIRADAPATGLVVRWFVDRRPLGESTLESPWAADVYVDAPTLSPSSTGATPERDAAYDAACANLRALVARAIVGLHPPPSNALIPLSVAEHAEPDAATHLPTVVGAVWLDPSCRPGPALRIDVPGRSVPENTVARVSAPGIVDLAVPIAGWIRLRGDVAMSPEARRDVLSPLVVRCYEHMLDGLVRRVQEHPSDDAALAHLTFAACERMFLGDRFDVWARTTRVPGSWATFRDLGAFRWSGRVLRIVDAATWEAQPSANDIAATDRPFLAVMREAGVAKSADGDSAVPDVIVPSAPTRDNLTAVAVRALQLLRLAGMTESDVQSVDIDRGVVAKRGAVRMDGNTARVSRKTPVVEQLARRPGESAARWLAMMTLGALNRASTEVTDAAEIAALQRLLANVSRRTE